MFKIIKKSKLSKSRLGLIKTNRGVIETPFFMPDATRAVIKNTSLSDIKGLKAPALVVNTLHLYLSPGLKVIKRAGGVNGFMSWSGPLLSDSGGYQVFSLIYRHHGSGKITNDRVIFKSPGDGSAHSFTPELSVRAQFDLGTSMIVCLDDCPPNETEAGQIKLAVERTIAWAKRGKAEFARQVKIRKLSPSKRPLLFAVIQGGTNLKLRQLCSRALRKIGFDGYGFGARPIDSRGNFLYRVLAATADSIPEDKLRFGLGLGLPEDIIASVKLGWDMFDCVIPTREGRHGKLFLWNKIFNFPPPRRGRQFSIFNKTQKKFYNTINIKNTCFKNDFSPINSESKLAELRHNSKAYLHHLFKINEPLGARLASLNNFEFYLALTKLIRQGIRQNLI